MSVLDFMEEKKPRKKKEVKEIDVPMEQFTCASCGNKYFDMKSYFYGTKSTKCLWCTKYPKQEKKKK